MLCKKNQNTFVNMASLPLISISTCKMDITRWTRMILRNTYCTGLIKVLNRFFYYYFLTFWCFQQLNMTFKLKWLSEIKMHVIKMQLKFQYKINTKRSRVCMCVWEPFNNPNLYHPPIDVYTILISFLWVISIPPPPGNLFYGNPLYIYFFIVFRERMMRFFAPPDQCLHESPRFLSVFISSSRGVKIFYAIFHTNP